MNALEIKEKILDDANSLIIEIKDKIILEDFDLKHYTIDKVIVFTNCQFERDVLFQYSILKHTIKFKRCKFKGQVIWGDEYRSETVSLCEKDIYFEESIFLDKVCLDGIVCKGSLFFKKCRFLFKTFQTNSNEVFYGLSISSSQIYNSINFEHSVFQGGLNLNACRLGIGLCLNHVKFLNKNSSINFVAANLGVACEINGGYYKCNNIEIENIYVSSHLKFLPKEIFQWDKNDFLIQSIDKKTIKNKFIQHGIKLNNSFILDKNEKIDDFQNKYLTIKSNTGYYILIDCDTYFNVLEGVYFENISRLNLSYSKVGVNIGFNFVVVKSGFIDLSNINCREIKITNSELESNDIIDFRHTNLSWILDLNNSYFRTQSLTFNGLTCQGGAFFRDIYIELLDKAECNLEYPDIDLSFCLFGKNLQFYKFKATNNTWIRLEASKIGDSLVLNDINSSKDFLYIYLQETKVNKLEINNLKNTFFDFNGFKFNSFSSNDEHWDIFVQRQLPDSFTINVYNQMEKYFTSITDIEEANKVYYKGRCAYREVTKKKWGAIKYLSDTFLKYSLHYGTKNENKLLVAILIFIVLGALIINYYVSDNTTFFACLQQSLVAFFPFGGLRDISINYSIKPDNYFNGYFIIHRVIGFILIPVVIASLTGFIKKKDIS
jgi:hypothetical protein